MQTLWLEAKRRLKRKRGDRGETAVEQDLLENLLQWIEPVEDTGEPGSAAKNRALKALDSMANQLLIARLLEKASKQRSVTEGSQNS